MNARLRSGMWVAGVSVAMAAGLQAKMVVVNPMQFNPGGPMIPAPATGAARSPATQAALPPMPKPEIAKIKADIKALNSGRYAVREKAAKDLLAMGDPVVPYLKAALKGLTTPEMRHLLRHDIRAIARMDLMRGPLITLNLHNVSANQAIDDVCKQAGMTANFFNGTSTSTVTLKVKNAPFWKVIAMLAAKTGLSPAYDYMNTGPAVMQFSQGQNSITAYTSFDGAFAVSLTNSNYQRTCNFTQAKPVRTSYFTINANLLILPNKIGNVQTQAAVITKAVDSKGQSLLTPNTNNFYGGPVQGAIVNCNFNLNYPKHPTRRIKIIKGYIPITAAVGRKVYIVHISPKKTEHMRIDGVRLKIGPESMVNNNWQFQYTLSWSGPLSPAVQNIQSQLSNTNAIMGQAANGMAASYMNCISSNGAPNQTVDTIQTNIQLAKITFVVFRRTVNLKIPFKFTNVPMP